MKAAKYPHNPVGRRIAKALWLLLTTPVLVLAVEDEPLGWANPYVEGEQQAWQEEQGELPPYPEKGNLLEVDAGTEGLQYTVYLDKPSLVKRDDGVVRYTVILVSSTGVWNVSNEGLHCGEKMFRRYAYGVDDKWQAMADSPWRVLRGKGANRYRMIFYNKFICDPVRLNQSAVQILDRFQQDWDEPM
jgi:hypothetical protein